MRSRLLPAAACLGFLVAAWVGTARPPAVPPAWPTVFDADGLTVRRSPSAPAAYLLAAGGTTVLVDAPLPPDRVPAAPIAVLLTHSHRDTTAGASAFAASGVPVLAAPGAADHLSPGGVAKFWTTAVPLRDSRTSYFVPAVGVAGVRYTLDAKYELRLGAWQLSVVPTPGHARDHVAVVAARDGRSLVFCGDAVTGDGEL